jgi:hypothetical protein
MGVHGPLNISEVGSYQVRLNLACWSGEEDFLKKKNSVYFCYYLPLVRGNFFHLNKLEFPPPKNDLCQVWLEMALWFWKRRFLNDPYPFLNFCDYPTLRTRPGPLIQQKFYSLHPRIMCTKFDWIWPAGSWEDFF